MSLWEIMSTIPLFYLLLRAKSENEKNCSLMRNPEGQSQGLPFQAHLLQKFKTTKLA